MTKGLKIAFIISGIAITVGLIFVIAGFAAAGFNVNGLNSNNIITEEYTIDAETFDSIDIESSIVDVLIVSTVDYDDTIVKITQDKSISQKVNYENGKLTVVSGDRPWYRSFGFFWGEMRITVYIPSGECGALDIETETGDITVASGLTFRSAELASDTGDVTYNADVTDGINVQTDTGDIEMKTNAGNILAESDTGDITLINTIASGKINLSSDTGEIDLEGCDAPDIYIETSTGDISADLNSGKIFNVDSDLGEVEVPLSDPSGGACVIRSSTGDIEVEIKRS